MLCYLMCLSHQMKTIRFDLLVDEDVWPYLSDRPGKREIRDQFAMCIVSMEGLDGLAVDADDLSVAIEVADEQAPWNAGTWRWTIEDGVLRAEPSGRADLRCSIAALSIILSGFTDFSEMIGAGRVEQVPTYAGQGLPKATMLADYFQRRCWANPESTPPVGLGRPHRDPRAACQGKDSPVGSPHRLLLDAETWSYEL